MYIQTETTPNPKTIKFLPEQPVLARGTAEFTDAQAAKPASPLAARLLEMDGVERILLGADYIAVSVDEPARWSDLKIHILSAIADQGLSGLPVLNDDAAVESAGGTGADEDEVSAQIRELIDSRVRPMVAMDGGDIVFDRFDRGIVYLHMRGACSGCPSATATLKSGVENMLRHYVPEVLEVRPVE